MILRTSFPEEIWGMQLRAALVNLLTSPQALNGRLALHMIPSVREIGADYWMMILRSQSCLLLLHLVSQEDVAEMT